MIVAIDKNSIEVAKKDGNEYIYLFENEDYKTLLNTKLHCVRYDLCKYADINLTNYNIDCLKKAKITDKDWNKLPKAINFKLGVIIPNYNYSHTLNKCIDSVLSQTYQNYEIIYVDDMSTDNSIEIMQEYQAKNKDKIKIVQLKQKRYNGGARNEAYLHLSKDVDYVYYIDSDDWLADNEAFTKINRKLQKKPDVLFVGMKDNRNGVERVVHIPEYKDRYEALQGWSGSCGKVIKKSLATKQECLYNEGTLKEDKNQHCRICFYMKNFELLKEPIYVWNRSNTKSVTTVRDEILWGTSTIRHYADTLQLYLSVKGEDPKIDKILNRRVKLTKAEIEKGSDNQW